MEQPTPDELRRVAEYWQWVKDMACEHPEWTINSIENQWTCSSCGHPLIVMSHIQLEAATNKKGVNHAAEQSG